ncbi:MAG: endolytic transglycosylase MltG [Proteobacteria bacterium]|nr:endolytic transglycosylase MltG [Pseudomonadota bacterium]
MSTIKTILLFSLFLSVCIVLCFGLDLYFYSKKPKNKIHQEKIFTVDHGQSLAETALKLSDEGLIRTPFKFKMVARIKKSAKKIKAGEFLLSPDMSPNDILDAFINGRVFLHKVTIPEGYSITQIAAIIENAGLGSSKAFIDAASDKSFARSMGIPSDSFEGYLYPETYYFPKGLPEKEMIRTMVNRLRSVITPEWEMRARELNMSIHQILTLASIIEKETGTAHERPVISSVFHNRLKKNMRLESDPTVIYGISDFNGNITRKDLKTPTPYNTYRIKGLPLGPITNPGHESIEAALYPDNNDYLYFVSKKDTTHQFSTNIKDHNKAVRQYQLRRK